MIGDNDAVNPLAAAGLNETRGLDKGVFGVDGVAVKFGF